MIIEILGAILTGFFGFIKGVFLAIPSIIELKDVLEKLTPMGVLTELLAYLGIPAILITIVVFIIKKVKT